MSDWIFLGNINNNLREWQLSPPFQGNLLKLEMESNTIYKVFRGLIGLYAENSYYNIQEFFSTPENQIFLFSDISFQFPSWQLAVRNITKYIGDFNWQINIYYYDEIINPYVPNLILDYPVNLTEETLQSIEEIVTNNTPLIDIQNIVNQSIQGLTSQLNQVNNDTANTYQISSQILTFLTGGI